MDEKAETLPHVSILVSTRQRRDDLRLLLEALPSVDYPPEKREIVVVEETDFPQDIPGVRYIAIPEENRGFGYTRNVAVANASHGIVVFIDDDCLPERDWLKALVQPLEDHRVSGVAGAVKVRGCNTIGTCENVLGFPGGGLKYIHRAQGVPRETREISTLNAAYRKEALLQAGGFEEDTRYSGEDYLLAKGVCSGNRCVYVPTAVVYHKVRGTLWANLNWFIRRGRSDMGVLYRIEDAGNHFGWLVRSSLLTKAVAGSLLFGLLTQNLMLGLLLFLLLYYGKNLFAYAYSYRYLRSVPVLLVTPVVKLVMDIGTDLGRFDYWLFRRKGREP